ncbi:hypothetical protein SUGI_0098720 [Cryptomeria japonica]|nr:hypothetical protein SUGI_0098720 [Cryptomeria japonica]
MIRHPSETAHASLSLLSGFRDHFLSLSFGLAVARGSQDTLILMRGRTECPSSAEFNGGIMAFSGVRLERLLGPNEHGGRNGGIVDNGESKGGENGFCSFGDPKKQILGIGSTGSVADV